jgi:hypothetical protein
MQVTLWCMTTAAILLVFLRAAIVIPRYWSREHRYPAAWAPQQVKYLEIARSYVGMVLMVAWAFLLAASPFLPLRYPFSQSSAVLLIVLLVQTYAWLIMVIPQDWNNSPIARLKFGHVLGGVLLWWVTFLGLTLYLIAAMAGPSIFQQPLVPPNLG